MEPKQLLDNLSTHLKNSLARAIAIASALHHEHVSTLHLLYGVFDEPGAIGAELLKKEGLTKESLETALAHIEKVRINPTQTPTLTVPELDKQAKKVLERAMLLAYERSQTYIGTEHLLYGIFFNDHHRAMLTALTLDVPQIQSQITLVLDSSQHFPNMNDVSEVMEDLQSLARELSQQHQETDDHIHNDSDMTDEMSDRELPPTAHQHRQPKGDPKKQQRPRALDIFTVELTSKDYQKNLDPVIGRNEEIERLIHIVCRRNKNNPVLVGEPGVGKTAIVEGLAKRIAEHSVPEVLQRKKIYAVDLPLLISGTIYRGEFEARLKQLIDECSADPHAILFIDEIHNIIGAGSNSGTMDAANILKPALARGLLHCIGATTIDEFKKHIMSDPALERRFQQIEVEEPSETNAIEMLLGIKKYYEQFHQVQITPEAVQTAVQLSTQYIHGQFLPDKAIDLLDESAAALRVNKKPTKQELELRKLEQKRDDAYTDKERAIKAEKLEEAMAIKTEISKIESALAKLKKTILKTQPKQEKEMPLVTEHTIATLLGKRLHIEPNLLLQNEFERLSTLKETLKTNIIGQDLTIDSITKTLQQAYLNTNHTRKGPRASLLFAGPSGVGKTKLASVLAKTLFFDEAALLRMDMSEFSEAHGVSKLLGSPAGYIGYKERNRFLDALSKRPQCVVLFDEFDKAHGDVKKLLYQILDDGILTDSGGKKYSFKHTIVILTTNIGAELYTNHGVGFTQQEKQQTQTQTRVQAKLKEELGSAFLGRLSTTCIFSPLTKEDIVRIIQKQLTDLNTTINSKHTLSLSLDHTALETLISNTPISETGARLIERSIEQLFFEQAANILSSAKKTKKKQWVITHTNGTYVAS
jgi:ATP-dependent Clp protease ATP-binding subunit ClpC